ncbi:hypothetical protein BSLG_000013 [Batrachochytrium salamandrivorans]|nr:hypothetical protein BSLG_000013 [Batrachochytrium salamandrivorans]
MNGIDTSIRERQPLLQVSSALDMPPHSPAPASVMLQDAETTTTTPAHLFTFPRIELFSLQGSDGFASRLSEQTLPMIGFGRVAALGDDDDSPAESESSAHHQCAGPETPQTSLQKHGAVNLLLAFAVATKHHLRNEESLFRGSAPLAGSYPRICSWCQPPAIVNLPLEIARQDLSAIGGEIENPFGYDPNDLKLDKFCRCIQSELREMLLRAPLAHDQDVCLRGHDQSTFKTDDPLLHSVSQDCP